MPVTPPPPYSLLASVAGQPQQPLFAFVSITGNSVATGSPQQLLAAWPTVGSVAAGSVAAGSPQQLLACSAVAVGAGSPQHPEVGTPDVKSASVTNPPFACV
jgi:hypothetical protein